MDRKIYVSGTIDVPENQREAVFAELPTHIKLSQAETGNLEFQIKHCPDVAGRLLVNEVFHDAAAFKTHQDRSSGTSWAKASENVKRDIVVKEGVNP